MSLPFCMGPLIGRGTQAEVHLARTPQGGPWLAVKLPRTGHCDALRAEARLLPGLVHPGIVPFHSSDATSAQPFVATAWLPGGDLHWHIRQGAWPAHRVASAVAPVAAALDWLHGRGVVHGDIKPANLVLDGAGHAHLIDFAAGAAHATVAYASAERRLGLPPDPRDDVFSMAAVIWAWLTGQPAFADDPLLHLAPPSRPPGLPRTTWASLVSALAPDRADRPASVTELTAAAFAGMPCHG